MEKRKRRRKKKKKNKERRRSSSRTVEDEGVISVLLFFFFFLRNLSSSSLFFFFFPYKSLCSRFEIIRSPFDLCSSLCSFISFSFLLYLIITSYWCIGQNSPEKLKQKETVWTSKTSHGSENCTVRPRFARVPAFFT